MDTGDYAALALMLVYIGNKPAKIGYHYHEGIKNDNKVPALAPLVRRQIQSTRTSSPMLGTLSVPCQLISAGKVIYMAMDMGLMHGTQETRSLTGFEWIG